jgi:trehalose synthase
LHLLLAFYNAFQPGVFALSGWDLVGALTLPPATVKDRLADGDTRWINRGAYDLIGSNPQARRTSAGLPVAIALYGPLPKQLERADSFASELARMLKVRADLRLYAGELIDVPEVQAKGLFVLVHRLPQGDFEITAINFGATPVDETVTLKTDAHLSTASDVLGAKNPAIPVDGQGRFKVSLKGFEGRAFLAKRGG